MDLNFRINFKVKLNSEKFAKQWRNRTQRLDLVKSSFKLLALDLSTNQSDPSKATKTFGKNQNRKEQSPDSWFARDQLAAKSERGPICLESARIHPESIVFQFVQVWLRKMAFALITRHCTRRCFSSSALNWLNLLCIEEPWWNYPFLIYTHIHLTHYSIYVVPSKYYICVFPQKLTGPYDFFPSVVKKR